MALNAMQIVLVACIVCAGLFIGIVIHWYIENPFHYPYFDETFDVSRRRNVNVLDYIDYFLNDQENWKCIQKHEARVHSWENKCEDYLKICHFKKRRRKQYEKVNDYRKTYRFSTTRDRTRYWQSNYVKHSYIVSENTGTWCCDYDWLCYRHDLLAQTGYTCSIREYENKNQRGLMTKALRKQIMERDNYTCQICGKYMPDEIGLQIDHIIPISRGGKTIPSNLRVLCNRCNAHKGSKFDHQCKWN